MKATLVETFELVVTVSLTISASLHGAIKRQTPWPDVVVGVRERVVPLMMTVMFSSLVDEISFGLMRRHVRCLLLMVIGVTMTMTVRWITSVTMNHKLDWTLV